MPMYEYKVVPAPKKGLKGKGIKGAEERFANALMVAMNELGAEGWEYQRSDTLPCEERTGMMAKSTVFLNMLVFRREVVVEVEAPAPVKTIAPSNAPQLSGVTPEDSGAAPELGPATEGPAEATEVKDPRE